MIILELNWLAGMFYNSVNLFECKNILLGKDTGCFAAFIQTAVGRQLTSSAKVHLTACPTSRVFTIYPENPEISVEMEMERLFWFARPGNFRNKRNVFRGSRP